MVARELEKAGVPKERMIIEAMGERFASSDAAADDQAFERCVEIRFESARFARQQLSVQVAGQGRHGTRLAPPTVLRLALDHEHTNRRFQNARCAGEATTPAADRLLAGDPAAPGHQLLQRCLAAVLTPDAGRARAAKWRIRYSESEFCCLTRGRVALENLGGRSLGVRSRRRVSWCRQASRAPGKCIEDCTKFYAIFEART